MRKPSLHNNKQRGQAILLIAVLMVALIAALGLAIDGGGMFLLYRDVQNATDAAGLSAAFALCTGDNPEDAAAYSADLNGFVNGVDLATVTVNHPPLAGTYTGDDDYLMVTITAEKPSYFIRIVYRNALIVRATTTAQCDPGSDYGFPTNAAIVTLRPNGCPTPPMNAGGDVTVNIFGSVFINHDTTPGVDGSGCPGGDFDGNDIPFRVTEGVCALGTFDSSGTDIAALGLVIEENCDDVEQITDPEPLGLGTSPEAECGPFQGALGDYAAVGSAPPGEYSNFNLNSSESVELQSGVYCVRGSITINGSASLTNEPDGVLIYHTGSGPSETFSSAGSSTLDISAMLDGDFAGLLYYTRNGDGLTNAPNNTWSGGGNLGMRGTVYAPYATCTIDGNSETHIEAQFICYETYFAGTPEIFINYEPSFGYQSPPSFGITE